MAAVLSREAGVVVPLGPLVWCGAVAHLRGVCHRFLPMHPRSGVRSHEDASGPGDAGGVGHPITVGPVQDPQDAHSPQRVPVQPVMGRGNPEGRTLPDDVPARAERDAHRQGRAPCVEAGRQWRDA
ncbi:hypothetical protein C4L39_26145 [Clostridium diolis]|nr:hypothetical protein C4L39_26145 [Clostridium diolis]